MIARHPPRRVVALLVLMLASAYQLPVAATPYWFGLDFIDTPTPSPTSFFFDFQPFSLTDEQNYFVTEGALAGWSEDAARRAVALAVEDIFNAIDVGDPGQRLRLGLFADAAPTTMWGQRLNVALGRTDHWPNRLGETPRPGDYYNPSAADTHVSAVYLNNLDRLSETGLNFELPSQVVNLVAGTTAHEIGHVFGLSHTNVSLLDNAPWPVMAVESTGLSTSARLTERRFSTTRPAGQSSAQGLINVLGAGRRADFNQDLQVNEDDLAILLANFGGSNRLFVEGDANGDHYVDNMDASWLIQQWDGPLPPDCPEGGQCPVAFSIPEPGALVLACWFGCLGARRRVPRPQLPRPIV